MALVKNPLFARYFNRFGARREERGNRELRREMLAGLSGRVIEVGAGNGLNFPHYPLAVREVVAVEPEPYLRARATEAAAAAPVPVRVTDGTAGDLPAADGEFNAVVVSGLLCSVPDVPAALAEFGRVLRPGGQLRFYEHVRSRDTVFARYQKATDLIWPQLMGGCTSIAGPWRPSARSSRSANAAVSASHPPRPSRRSPPGSSAWPARPLLPRFDHAGGWLAGLPVWCS